VDRRVPHLSHSPKGCTEPSVTISEPTHAMSALTYKTALLPPLVSAGCEALARCHTRMAMTHSAIQETLNGKTVEWMKVIDEELAVLLQ
jgi:hypothetical protein